MAKTYVPCLAALKLLTATSCTQLGAPVYFLEGTISFDEGNAE